MVPEFCDTGHTSNLQTFIYVCLMLLVLPVMQNYSNYIQSRIKLLEGYLSRLSESWCIHTGLFSIVQKSKVGFFLEYFNRTMQFFSVCCKNSFWPILWKCCYSFSICLSKAWWGWVHVKNCGRPRNHKKGNWKELKCQRWCCSLYRGNKLIHRLCRDKSLEVV